MSHNTHISMSFLMSGLLALSLTGCQYNSTKPIGQQEEFSSEKPGPTNEERIMEAQFKAYAVKDGMLYDYHFDGEYLNSLGLTKLHLMATASDHPFPIVVYLNVPDDRIRPMRQLAATACLKDFGLHEEQFKFEYGPNPNMNSPVAPNLRRYGKTEDLSPVGGTGPVDQGGSASQAPSGPTDGK